MSRMSEYQPGRIILEEKVFPDVDVSPRYSEFGKAIKAESVEDPTSTIHADSDSGSKEQSPPSLPPRPPPRSAKTEQRKPKTKQQEVSQQHSSENSGSKKRPKGGSFEEKKADLTQHDSKHENNEKCHVAVSNPTKVKTKDTSRLAKKSDSTNILPRPNLSDVFEKISKLPDAVKEAYMTERYCGTIMEETVVKDNTYEQVTFVKKGTKSTKNTDKYMGSAGNELDNKCNEHFKTDSDKAEIDSDENAYVRMGYVEIETATVHVISPEASRKAKTKPFKCLSKRQLVRRLEECGLENTAAVCEKEKLDGHFLEKYVSDEDLMQEPFLLTRFQIKKVRAIIDGWGPISDFTNNVDSASD